MRITWTWSNTSSDLHLDVGKGTVKLDLLLLKPRQLSKQFPTPTVFFTYFHYLKHYINYTFNFYWLLDFLTPIFSILIWTLAALPWTKLCLVQMDVSKKNGGTPISFHFNRVFHYFNHPFWVYPDFWFNTQMDIRYQNAPWIQHSAPEWLGAALPFAGSWNTNRKYKATSTVEKTPRENICKDKKSRNQAWNTWNGFWNNTSSTMCVAANFSEIDRDCITKASFHMSRHWRK